MKKLFSFIMVALMSIMTLNAETTRIYCKMSQGWWTEAGAAVGCHSWGTPGPGTTWPGVRMTPVKGETDMWYIDLDVTKVQNVIFTRFNPTDDGNLDWGAKTKDLTIPTDGKNLFTITTTKAVWGDPGCDGEWSVYGGAVEKPKHDYKITAYLPQFCDDIAAYADSARVMGGFDDWSNGIWMEKKIDEDFNDCWYAEIKDVEEDTEFKLRFGKDADWKVQVQLNGANMANEAFGETTDIVLHYDGEGYGFAACAVPAARKEFVFIAGEAAEANPALFAITWGKDGSNETVKMTQKGEEALYTANILETVDSVVLVRCASDATEIIWDGEGKNVWNQTANYELCDTMSFVAWVEETNLFAITCDTPKPVETKYYAKNNWDGGEWSWKEMTQLKETFYRLDSVVFGGTGININTKEEDTDAFWFDVDHIAILESDFEIIIKLPTEDTVYMKPPMHVPSRHLAAEEPQLLKLQAGDTIMLFFNAADTTLYAGIYGRPAPAARKEFVFVAGEAAEANPAMFAITWGKDGSNETVKMTQKGEEALYTANILETVDSVVLVRCASDATEIIWDGEGKNVWNQTANYELCDTMSFVAWVEETNLFAITCDTPKPVETKYYAKNNWNGGEWSWKEMSATNKENIYMLDSVVFGGTGININTKEEDTDAFWFDIDHINAILDSDFEIIIKLPTEDTVYMKPPMHVPSRHLAAEELQPFKLQAGDTIMLFFNAADTTLRAGIYGRPAPAARKEFVFVAGEAAEANPTMFAITWGKDGSSETVKMTQKGEEALYTAEILETVDSVVLVRCASDATEIIWDGEGKNVWNQTANYELCDTMSFVAWVEETNLFAITCDTPKPVETKYYAKNNWNGGEWSWKEMTQLKETVYTLDSVVFGGTGININTKEEDTDAFWFDVDKIVIIDGDYQIIIKKPTEDTVDSRPIHVASRHLAAEEPQPLKLQAGDTIMLFFNAADTTLYADIYGRPAPAARKEFVFVAGEAAEANPTMFAITWGKDGSSETVKMTQKGEEALYTAEILETVDSVVLVRCASDATEIIWDGEGKNVWNQTANYELCDTMSFVAWVEETNLFAITCDTPKPVETKYYAKNNWNGGEWSWKEMTQFKETVYTLDSVVFGGTGININTKEEDTDAFWFDVDHIVILESDYQIIIKKPTEDTVDSRPIHVASRHLAAEEPQPLKLQAGDTIMLFFNAADTTLYADIYGRPEPAARKEFVFVAGEAAEANPTMFAITWGKDGSSETVKMTQKGEEALYTAEILETVDSVVLVRCASDATEIIWDGEGKNVWNQTANYELCDTMSFVAWVEETNLFAITCDTPKPVETKYYVTGNAALVGEEKAWQADAIEMVDYTYTFPMLAAGEYQLKVTDGTWEHAWGYDNLSPTVAVEGLYTDVDGNICFTVYTPNDVTVTFAQGYVVVTGNFTNDPTGLIEIMRNAKDGKFIINGNMIIRRNGALYTIQGARL